MNLLFKYLSLQALLGDRYGYRPPPPEIDVAEFELILSAEGALDTSVLNVWYKKDLNAQPPVYVLQVNFKIFFLFIGLLHM